MTTVSGIFDFVRLDIGDENGAIFNDALLTRVMKKSVVRLNNKLGISANKNRSIGTGSTFGGRRISISPIQATPEVTTSTPTPDNDEIHDLITLQMEVIILKSEMSALRRLNASLGGAFNAGVTTAVNDDISVKNADGVTIKVGANRFGTRARLMREDLQDKEEELKLAIKQLKYRMSGGYGKMVY